MSDYKMYEDKIVIIPPNDHIRMRPGMIFGGVHENALYEWLQTPIYEVVAMAHRGFCNHLLVTLQDEEVVVVEYEGPGIPTDPYTDPYKEDVKSVLEVVMSHSSYWNENYSGITGTGLMGVGFNGLNALSAHLTVETKWNGHLWKQTYAVGKPISTVEKVRELEAQEKTGAKFTFQPDFTIFERNEIQFDRLADRLRELSFLTPGLKIVLRDEKVGQQREEVFHSVNGVPDFIEYLNRGQETLTPIIAGSRKISPSAEHDKRYSFYVSFAIQYCVHEDFIQYSYANTWQTSGGTHVDAMNAAINSALKRYRAYHSIPGESDLIDLQFDDVKPGLTAVIYVQHPYASFASHLDMRLLNPDVYGEVSALVFEVVTHFLDNNGKVAQVLTQLR